MKKDNPFIIKISDVIIDNIISVIVSSIIATIVAVLIKTKTAPSTAAWFAVAIVAIISYIATSYIRLKPHKFSENFISIKPHFEYRGDQVYVRTEYTVRALKPKLKKLYTRREWYSDDFEVRILTDGYKLEHIKSDEKVSKYEYQIVFPKPLHLFQKATYEIEFIGNNQSRQFRNYYGIDVIAPTSKLEINVNVPMNYSKNKAVKKVYYDHETNVYSNETIDFNGFYKWEPKVVKLGWSYMFEWEWSDNEKELINNTSIHNNKF